MQEFRYPSAAYCLGELAIITEMVMAGWLIDEDICASPPIIHHDEDLGFVIEIPFAHSPLSSAVVSYARIDPAGHISWYETEGDEWDWREDAKTNLTKMEPLEFDSFRALNVYIRTGDI